ncbi:unnamed protein product, partial [Amoebophrya sp. A25]
AHDNSGGELATPKNCSEADCGGANLTKGNGALSVASLPSSGEHTSRFWSSMFSDSYTFEFYMKYDGEARVLFSTNPGMQYLLPENNYSAFTTEEWPSDIVNNTPIIGETENHDFDANFYDLTFADTPGGINYYAR